MGWHLLADAVLVAHAAFIAFVVLGGLAVRWRSAMAVPHLAAVAWGAWVISTGRICPLTPLENQLRQAAGQAGYAGGFVEHYLVNAIYPPGLTRGIQVALAAAIIALNLAVYLALWRRQLRQRRSRMPPN